MIPFRRAVDDPRSAIRDPTFVDGTGVPVNRVSLRFTARVTPLDLHRGSAQYEIQRRRLTRSSILNRSSRFA
jgi:hypothetical protein